MSAAVMGTRYSPPSPPETQSSSETMSPIYPERPIKPLPKRRLKDRLSSGAAESISWPPAPPASNPLFYPSSYESNTQQFQQNMQNGAVPDIDKVLIEAQAGYPPKDAPYEFHGTDPVSDDENCRPETYRSHAIRAQSHSVTSAESDHGYDSFENSNNKKKRKIPTSSSNGVHPSLAGISADMANMGISSAPDGIDSEDAGTQQYYGQGYPAVPISGTGISGAGRGRYGRSGRRDSRSPLSASANASNWQAGRMAGARHVSGKYAGKAEHGSESGIISQAIADAANSPLSLDKGQENVSLLEQQQQRSTKKNTAAAQFTFNLDSEAAKGPAWPGDRLQSQYPSPPPVMPTQQLPPNAKGYSQGTQTSPSMAGQNQQGAAAPGAQPPAPPPKPRRPASVRYARAARNRKLEQEYQNYQNPKAQDMWICEFCEYEAIFGHPPRALIRSYEAKDAKERRKQAEKKRLLEKAKSKGRKARKGTKAAKANAAANAGNTSNNTNSNAAPAASGQQSGQQPYANTGQPPDPQPQSDEYYSGDGYEDDGDPPISTPTPPSKIPGPVNAPYGATQRPSGGNSAVYAEPRPEPRQRAAT